MHPVEVVDISRGSRKTVTLFLNHVDRTAVVITSCACYEVCKFALPYTQAMVWVPQRGNQAIQIAFPDLDARLREVLVSGTTPAEWDETFKGKAGKREDYPGDCYKQDN